MTRLPGRSSARFTLLVAAAAAAAAAAMPARAATPVVQNVSVGTQPRDIVYNAAALKPFVDAAKTRRVDIAGIGDSNQVAGPGSDYGWDHGYAKAWSDRYGAYATGLFGTNADGGWNGPQGYIDSWGSPYGAARTGAPAALDKYKLHFDSQADGFNDFPPNYAYFGPTYAEPTNAWSPMLTIRKESPLWGQNLRWHLTYGTFDNGAGGFTPSVSSQGVKLAAGARVDTSTGSIGLADSAFDIPAAAYTNAPRPDINMGLSYSGEGSMRGSFFGLWQRAEGDRKSGVSYSTTLWQGGRALVHAATALKTQSDDALKEYLRNAVKLQGGEKMLLVQVNHGGNDGGWTIPSVGPNSAPSHTPAGFADNMEAVISRMRGVWTAMGHDPKNLMFQYGPYHPIAGLLELGGDLKTLQRQADWEAAVVKLAQQHPEYNLAIVRGTRITTPQTMEKNGWYASATDHGHLSAAGYIGVAELGVRQAIGYATADDIENRSNVTSLSFTFDRDVSANLSADDLALREVGKDALDPFNFAVNWDKATNTATWTFQGLPMGELPVGEYEAVLHMSQLGDVVGSAAAGAGTGVASTDSVFRFTAAPIPEPALSGAVTLAALGMLRRRRRG